MSKYDAETILDFLSWMGREHSAILCSPGYAGEMLDLGGDLRKFVEEFLKSRPAPDGGSFLLDASYPAPYEGQDIIFETAKPGTA